MNFKQLISILGLEEGANRIRKTASLKNWCLEHISSDIQFQGDDTTIYDAYYQLAYHYLERFLPIASQSELGVAVSKLDNLSPIHYAARHGYTVYLSDQPKEKIAPVLNYADAYGLTPLHYATIYGHVEVVRILLQLGASPASINQTKKTPLFSCVMLPMLFEQQLKSNKTHCALQLIEVINKEAMEQKDESGNTVLHELAVQNLPIVLAKLLEKYPQLLFIKNNMWQYPIHMAILNGQKENVGTFLRCNGVEELVDRHGRNALHYSAFYGGKEMLSLCCSLCKDKNIRDEDGKTPLMQAAIAGRADLVAILLKHGADPSLTSESGKTALQYAKNIEVISYIEQLESPAKPHHPF